MGMEEAMSILSSQARGSMEDFLRLDRDTGACTIDLFQAQQRGQLHLIKKLVNRQGAIEIELYDAQTAVAHILRTLGAFKDHIHIGLKVDQVEHMLEGLPPEYRAGVMEALADCADETSQPPQLPEKTDG
jgi:hypothetical protein